LTRVRVRARVRHDEEGGVEASFAELVHEDIIALAHAAPGLVVVLGA